jgi:hypothetical protein
VSEPSGQPPYDTGYLRELVTTTIALYEIHPNSCPRPQIAVDETKRLYPTQRWGRSC